MDLLQLQNKSENLLVEQDAPQASLGLEGEVGDGFENVLSDANDLIALQQKIADSTDTVLLVPPEQTESPVDIIDPDDILDVIDIASKDMTTNAEALSQENQESLVMEDLAIHKHIVADSIQKVPSGLQTALDVSSSEKLQTIKAHVGQVHQAIEKNSDTKMHLKTPDSAILVDIESKGKIEAEAALPQQTLSQLRELVPLKSLKSTEANLDVSKTVDISQLSNDRSILDIQKSADIAPKMHGVNDTVLDMQASKLEQVAQQLGDRVIKMHNRNIQSAEIELHPAELGKLDIQLKVDGDKSYLVINTSSQVAREVLESQVDRLKHMMQTSGMELSGFDVSSQTQDSNRDELGSGVMQDATDVTPVENVSHMILKGNDNLLDVYV